MEEYLNVFEVSDLQIKWACVPSIYVCFSSFFIFKASSGNVAAKFLFWDFWGERFHAAGQNKEWKWTPPINIVKFWAVWIINS